MKKKRDRQVTWLTPPSRELGTKQIAERTKAAAERRKLPPKVPHK